MAKLVWGLLCQRVIVDQDSNTASYIDTVEELHFPSFPGVAPPVTVALLWERGDVGEVLVTRLTWKAPGAKKNPSFSPPEVEMPQSRHRMNVVVGGLPVKGPGRYEMVVDLRVRDRWKRVASLPVEVSSAE